jgi:hypothetical protein
MFEFVEQEQVINSSWINIKGIMKLIPICESRAKKVMKEIVEEMKSNNEFYFETRPRLIPTSKIVNKYNIDVNLIRREAKKLKEAK